MSKPERRTAFKAGITAIAPIIPGVVPFGLIAGIAAVEAGLDNLQAIAASPMIFAGASQLAMADLIGRGAAPAIIVLTALVINARFLMYSAGLAPWLREVALTKRSAIAYLLTDQAFAVSVIRFDELEESTDNRVAFYAGGALPMWLTWQISTVIGVLAGTGLPEAWSLDFAVPLVFMALLVPVIKDRPGVAAALTGALVAVAGIDLPYNLGLPIAALSGIAIGMVVPTKQAT